MKKISLLIVLLAAITLMSCASKQEKNELVAKFNEVSIFDDSAYVNGTVIMMGKMKMPKREVFVTVVPEDSQVNFFVNSKSAGTDFLNFSLQRSYSLVTEEDREQYQKIINYLNRFDSYTLYSKRIDYRKQTGDNWIAIYYFTELL